MSDSAGKGGLSDRPKRTIHPHFSSLAHVVWCMKPSACTVGQEWQAEFFTPLETLCSAHLRDSVIASYSPQTFISLSFSPLLFWKWTPFGTRYTRTDGLTAKSRKLLLIPDPVYWLKRLASPRPGEENKKEKKERKREENSPPFFFFSLPFLFFFLNKYFLLFRFYFSSFILFCLIHNTHPPHLILFYFFIFIFNFFYLV